MEAKYRKDYDGEFVIARSHWSQALKDQKREWIPNAIENHHISGRAAVIGSNTDLEVFDYKRLEKHRGGLLGKKKLQTYSCGRLWENMTFDFIAALDADNLNKINEKQYSDNNIVFTNSKNCLKYPGNFYLIPYAPQFDEIVLPIYLAAFDGHEEIFLLGYNNETPYGNTAWIDQINIIFNAYDTTKFILVGVSSNMPEIWRSNTNVSCMDYRTWISYCDI